MSPQSLKIHKRVGAARAGAAAFAEGDVHLLRSAAERGIRYRSRVASMRVNPTPAALQALHQLDAGLPDVGWSQESVLDRLDHFGTPATVATTGGRYFGFVNGSALPVTVAANWLATAWDQNACLTVMSPVAVFLEDVALRWTAELLGFPRDSTGALVTGASMANLTGLAAARHSVLTRAGWDVEQDGLFGAPPITVVVGEEAHSTLVKALGLLGMGRGRVVAVPTDAQGRMVATKLPRIAGPAIVCLQAGNVNSGAFDPAHEIVDAVHASGAWVHVDGAFGIWAAAAPARAHLMRGFERADSWATDAHKWLNVTYDCGIALVRDPAALRGAMTVDAAYLPADGVREPLHHNPEASRRARGVELWAALSTLGRQGVGELVEHTCRMAQRFALGLEAAGYEVLNDVVINQVLVSFGDDEETKRVIAQIQQDGVCWCGGTEWHGRAAMRISVSSYATTEEDVDASVAAMKLAVAKVRSAA